MSFFRRYAVPLNLLVILVTMVFVGAALVVGRAAAEPKITLSVGEPSPQTFVASSGVKVPDAAATDAKRKQEELAVETIYQTDPLVGVRVAGNLLTSRHLTRMLL